MEEERNISVFGNNQDFEGDDAPTMLLCPEDMPGAQKQETNPQTTYQQTVVTSEPQVQVSYQQPVNKNEPQVQVVYSETAQSTGPQVQVSYTQPDRVFHEYGSDIQTSAQQPQQAEVQQPQQAAVQQPRQAEVQQPQQAAVQQPRQAEVQQPRQAEVQQPQQAEVQQPQQAAVQQPQQVIKNQPSKPQNVNVGNVPEGKPKSGKSIAAFILGLLSVLCCPLSFLLGFIGLIIGIGSRKKKQAKKGLAVTGIVLSILGMLAGIATLIATIVAIVCGGFATVGAVVSIKQSIQSASNGSGNSDLIWEILANVDLDNIDWSDPNSLSEEITKAASDVLVQKTLEGEIGVEDLTNTLESIGVDTSGIEDLNLDEVHLEDFDIDKETIEGLINGELTPDDINKILGNDYEITDEQMEEILKMMEGLQ